MIMHEWPLIIFTILAQMSVGAFVVLGVMHFFVKRSRGPEEADRMSDRALLAIGPVLVLGLLGSILHLGNPLNAPLALTNIGSSWLSREIMFGVLFGGLGFVFAFLQWRKYGSITMRYVLAWAAALVGLALVYSMARVYMLDTQPAWNTWATPLLFFVTTFLLGSLAIGVALIVNYAYLKKKDPGCTECQYEVLATAMRWIALASIVLLGIELVTIPLQTASLAVSTVPQSVAAMNYTQFGLLFALRLILVFIGAGVFALFLYRTALSTDKERTLGYLVFGAFALVLVAEVMGRFLFYATHFQIVL